MGCGRLFEGTAEQMYANLQRIVALPEDVRIFCGHEYTLSNARFATQAEPGNAAIAGRLTKVQAQREAGQITLPTTVALERETNPFVRASDVEEFARLRREKDSFRSWAVELARPNRLGNIAESLALEPFVEPARDARRNVRPFIHHRAVQLDEAGAGADALPSVVGISDAADPDKGNLPARGRAEVAQRLERQRLQRRPR